MLINLTKCLFSVKMLTTRHKPYFVMFYIYHIIFFRNWKTDLTLMITNKKSMSDPSNQYSIF